jgi:hypothetical protein
MLEIGVVIRFKLDQLREDVKHRDGESALLCKICLACAKELCKAITWKS